LATFQVIRSHAPSNQNKPLGSSIPHIYYKDYSKLKLSVPSIKEQEKISKFMSSIDSQIELLESQINKSKTWKKGLLQKMFV